MYEVSKELFDVAKSFYADAKATLNEDKCKTVDDIKVAVKALFKQAGGSVGFSEETKRYIRYNGKIGDATISLGLSTDGIGFAEAVEDITTFYYKSLGGQSHYTPDFIDFLEGRVPRNGSEFKII